MNKPVSGAGWLSVSAAGESSTGRGEDEYLEVNVQTRAFYAGGRCF